MCKLSDEHQQLEDIYIAAQVDLGEIIRLKLNRSYGLRLSHLIIGGASVQAKQDGKWFKVDMVEDRHDGTNKRFLSFYSDCAVRLHYPVQIPIVDHTELYTAYAMMIDAYSNYIYRDS